MLRRGNFGAAILDCEAAIDLEPRYAKAQSRLGFAAYCAADYTRAIKALNSALDLDPASVTARKYLHLAQGRLIKSVLEAERTNASMNISFGNPSSAASHAIGHAAALKAAALLGGFQGYTLLATEQISTQRLPDHLIQVSKRTHPHCVQGCHWSADHIPHLFTFSPASRNHDPPCVRGDCTRYMLDVGPGGPAGTDIFVFKVRKLTELHKGGILSSGDYQKKIHRLQARYRI